MYTAAETIRRHFSYLRRKLGKGAGKEGRVRRLGY